MNRAEELLSSAGRKVKDYALGEYVIQVSKPSEGDILVVTAMSDSEFSWTSSELTISGSLEVRIPANVEELEYRVEIVSRDGWTKLSKGIELPS